MNSKEKSIWAEFSDLNSAYLADLFERYASNPEQVDPQTREFFQRWGAPPAQIAAEPGTDGVVAAPTGFDPALVAGAAALATAIRAYGYRAARVYPLGKEPAGDAALAPEFYGLREEQLKGLPASVVPGQEAAASAHEAILNLRRVYQDTSGFEFEHVSNAEERNWLRSAVESGRYRPAPDQTYGLWLLRRLSEVEAFERFLQSAFPTQTRFSLEGLDMMVPMLDELMCEAAGAEIRSLILGMAHRGRLNVLAHILGKPFEEIIAEFRGSFHRPDISIIGSSNVGWTGDVKYHLGGDKAIAGGPQVSMVVSMAPNPSHLEFVDPVVEGMARAASERRDQPGPAQVDLLAALPVLIHGDAAFPGEGIVAETLNLSGLPGYTSGGALHIIANNQLGFTTPPELGRSTLFSSDLAKGFEIPVIHVNADDPEACITAVRLAHGYIQRFNKDALIDLIGYRRPGHNEGDEPSFTQPQMYSKIAQHPTVRALWAQEIQRRGLATPEQAQAWLRDATQRLQAARQTLPKDGLPVVSEEVHPAGLEAGGTTGGLGTAGPSGEVETAVPVERLADLNEQLLALPEGFRLHPKLEPFYARRRAALATGSQEGERPGIDWAHAEALALGSILEAGTPIRLTGQDTSRGTFSQRHMLLHDAAGSSYVPLQHLPSAKASFDVWDSPLSEAATLGFEFGYDVQAPEALVLWEAQYGDFINAAQVIVDAFITSARSKWGQLTSLVLLLPHAYEGQGPEHSSARLERFLQMAAEDNMRIANCTTAAQYFHILRRQAGLLRLDPRPLVLMTPKSLLRHPLAASSVADLSEGRFQPVIDDVEARKNPAAVQKLLLCSGKVYVDLAAGRTDSGSPSEGPSVAIIRVEELYPFPAREIEDVLSGYTNLREVMWAQEEPRNMGAWTFVAPRLRDLIGEKWPVYYAGRTRRASPAEGSHEWHVREQKRLVGAAFSPEPSPEAGQTVEVKHGD